MKKRMIALLVTCTMFFGTISEVSAKDTADSEISPLWESIIMIGAYLEQSGYAEGAAMLKTNDYVYVRLDLQEKVGSRWVSTGDYNVGSGFGDCVVTDDFTLEDGVNYRAKVTVNAYDDSYQLIESDTQYSSVVVG